MRGIDVYERNAEGDSLDTLVSKHRSLVAKIAKSMKRKLPSHIELDDLIQSGFIGLLEANKTYKNDQGATFETYASIKIKGSIIDDLRRNSWGTRESLKRLRQLGEAVNRLEQREQKQPTQEEIAAELNMTMDEHIKYCQKINLAQVISLEHVENSNVFASYDNDPQDIVENEDMKNKIKNALEILPEREQILLSLYYIEELTLREVAEVLDLTEARVCQLHVIALAKIKNNLRS